MPKPKSFVKIEIEKTKDHKRPYKIVNRPAPIITQMNEYHDAHIRAWYTRHYKRVLQGAVYITKHVCND